MTGFEPQISGVGRDQLRATTTAQKKLFIYSKKISDMVILRHWVT